MGLYAKEKIEQIREGSSEEAQALAAAINPVAIQAAVKASGNGWTNLTRHGGADAEGGVDKWNGIQKISGGYNAESYDAFFAKYLTAPSIRYDPESQTGKLPTLAELKKYFPDANATTLESKWNAANEEQENVVADGNWRTGQNPTFYLKLYDLIGFATGIPPEYLPIEEPLTSERKEIVIAIGKDPSGQTDGDIYDYRTRMGDFHKAPEARDFQDVLLYLYSETDSALKAKSDKIKAERDKADLDSLTTGSTAEEAFKYEASKGLRSGELDYTQRSRLTAFATDNKAFFRNLLSNGDECVFRINLDSYQEAYIRGQKANSSRRSRYDEKVYQDTNTPAALINKLAHSPDSLPFLKVQTHEISQLMPMIRIYKTYYNKESNEIDKEVEFSFDGGTNALNPRSGIGIKSFDWSLNATNPATVKNDITATLVLYFQSFDDLLSKRFGRDIITATTEEYRFEDLLLRPSTNNSKIKDLGDPSSLGSTCTDKASQIFDARFYEIKALVGWAPTHNIAQQKTGGLTNSIKSQQLSLFLTLIDHEFSFTQQGTFELSISYRARMEALGTDPRLDVLSTKEVKDTILKIQADIDSLRASCGNEDIIGTLRDEISLQNAAASDLLATSIITSLEPYIYTTYIQEDELQEAILQSGRFASGSAAQQDNDRAIRAAVNALRIAPQRVRHQLANKSKEYTAETIQKLRDQQTNSQGRLSEKIHSAKSDTGLNSEEEVDDPENFYVDYTSTENRNTSGGERKKRIPWFYFGDLVDAVVMHATTGDLSQTANSQGAIAAITLKNLNYLLGTFDYSLDYLGASGGTNEDKVGMLGGIPILVSRYNDWFQKNIIITNRSTYPLIEFLRDFIKDVVLSFLNRDCFDYELFRKYWTTAAFTPDKVLPGAGGFKTDEFRLNPQIAPWVQVSDQIFKTAAISLSSIPSKETTDALGRNTLGSNPLEKYRKYPDGKDNDFIRSIALDFSNFSPENILSPRENSHSQTLKNSYHVSVFYLIGQDSYKALSKVNIPKDPILAKAFLKEYGGKNKKLDTALEWYSARESRDYNEGIYHLFLGGDKGLVKEVSFSKVDAPYLREARIQQDSLNPLALLAATYNVTLKMVGNTIFWPGQYIFVNPIGYGYGMGLPDQCGSVSNQLGLGGYHLVTEVKSFIQDGKYETVIKALFEFSGDGNPSLPKSTPANKCDSPLSSGNVVDVETP